METLSLRHAELGSFAMPREWTDWGSAEAGATLIADAFGLATLAGGQTGTASLRGTVTDPSGATVPNAKVSLINKERGF